MNVFLIRKVDMFGSFRDNKLKMLGCISRNVDVLPEHEIQDLLNESFSLIENLREFRYRLSIALYKKLSEK